MHRILLSRLFTTLSAGTFFLISPHLVACDCANASLYGDQIKVNVQDYEKTIIVNDSVELAAGRNVAETASTPLDFEIDVQHSSITVDFKRDANNIQLSANTALSLRFEEITPVLSDSACMASIGGMYIQSNNPKATSLNADSGFSDHTIDLVLNTDEKTKSGFSQWMTHHWVKVNLTFKCSASPPPPARNGMTWGFRGQSLPDGPAHIVQVGCNSVTEWASGQGMCDPYKGETRCSTERSVLCVQEAGNIPRPAYAVVPDKENFSGWFPGAIKLSALIRGDQLTSLNTANQFCGEGWQMAEFHNGHWIKGMDEENHHITSNPPWSLANANSSGGWNFHGQFQGNDGELHQLKTQRFWVHIRNQPANCWDD